MRAIPVFLLLAASSVWAQLNSNTITVTASRTVVIPPDSAIFDVYVSTPPDTSIDQVVASLQPAGITASDVTSVYENSFGPSPTMEWDFTLQVPITAINDTLKTLTAIQGKGGALSMSFNAAPQASTSAQTVTHCPMTDILADAKTQAQQFASLAGVTLGPVIALSDGGDQTAVPVGSFEFTAIGAIISTARFGLTSIPVPQTTPCTLTVEFSVLRY